MKESINYRRTQEADLLECGNLIMASFNDLRRKNNMAEMKFQFTEPDPHMVHWCKSDPEGTFVATHRGKIVGYTQALVRDDEWYLGFLFVLPKYQSLGVGGKLLKKAMDYGRAQGGVKRWALATFAYNPQALAVYSKHGMTPQSAVLFMDRTAKKGGVLKPIKQTKTFAVKVETGHKLINRLTRLDKKVRGIARPEEHFFWQDSPHHRVLVMYEGATLAGYCVISDKGAIGPIAAAKPEWLAPILIQGANYSRAQFPTRQWVQAHGANVPVMMMLLKNGFRVLECTTVMASESFSDPARYIPGHLAHY